MDDAVFLALMAGMLIGVFISFLCFFYVESLRKLAQERMDVAAIRVEMHNMGLQK